MTSVNKSSIRDRTKKKQLYLGLDPTRFQTKELLFHFPIIEVVVRPDRELLPVFQKSDTWSHIILTSRSSITHFFACCKKWNVAVAAKTFILIGQASLAKLNEFGTFKHTVASDECGEGIIPILHQLDKAKCHLFFPRSNLARPLICNFLAEEHFKYTSCILYDTVVRKIETLPDIKSFDEIIFTSPSQVDAFCALYGTFPQEKSYVCIGPITQKRLAKFLKLPYPLDFC